MQHIVQHLGSILLLLPAGLGSYIGSLKNLLYRKFGECSFIGSLEKSSYIGSLEKSSYIGSLEKSSYIGSVSMWENKTIEIRESKPRSKTYPGTIPKHMFAT